MPQTVHLQYNSPMGLYSKESAVEQYEQQIGSRPNDLPAADKHFDPSKSATLKYLQEADRYDGFGDNFFEKVAQAEAPNVPLSSEPGWARTAREKSERARSKTPSDPVTRYRPPSSPAPLNHPVHLESAREHADKNRTFTHTVQQPWGPSYYEASQQLNRGRRAHSLGRETAPRGYELGGIDYTGGAHIDHGTDYYYYEQPARKPEPPRAAPGYEMGGSDFYRGHLGGDGPYRGHGPDPPRLRPKYTADAHDPCNVAYAPNLNEVDANLLVGDTLSNQKIRHEVRNIDQSEFGTSFAAPQGFTRDHVTVRRTPEPQGPITFSVSAPRHRAHSAPRSSQPPEQQNVWNVRQAQTDKEVSIRTLLNDEALLAPRRETSPHWANESLLKQQAWKHRSDPRLDRYLTYVTEPNWRRSVDQRRLAWERRAFETEQRLSRPFSERVAPGAPPAWHDRAARTHETWQRQADNMQHQTYVPIDRSVPVQHQYESRQEQYTSSQNAPYQQTQQQTQQQFDQKQTYGTSNTDANVQRLVNSGFNTNQIDYVLSHKDHFVDGQPYHPPIVNQQGSESQRNYSSSQRYSSQTSNVATNQNASSTQAIPLGAPSDSQNLGYSYQTETRVTGGQPSAGSFGPTSYANQSNQQQSYHSSSQQQTSIPIQTAPFSSYQQSKQPISTPAQNYSSSYHTESHSTTKNQQPIALPAQNYSSSYHTESHSTTQKPLLHSPGGQSYKSEFSSSRYNKQESTTTTTTTQQPQAILQSTVLPATRTTTYNYTQRQVPTQPAQPSMQQESFTSRTEKTSSSSTAPVQQPASYQYENYLSSRKEENRREETTTSRPVSQLSQYSESKNYKRNYEEKTETKTIPAGGLTGTTTTYKDLSNAQSVDDVFNKKTEMAETLPLGSISNTRNNTQGGYRDAAGHDVSYKRETQTAADPGKEYALLKEEEKRVIETPLEPGVISRHVTTKYYKKKTVTDTTTTTEPA